MDMTDYLEGISERHTGVLTAEQQERLARSVICGGGAGGVGGWAYLLLARVGCRQFRLADPSSFDPSNVNRQAGSGFETLGRNKAQTLAEEIRKVNPEAQVQVFAEGLTLENVAAFVRGGSVVIDGVDLYTLTVKKRMFDEARAAGLPVFSCPVLGFGAALGIFDPTRSPDFETYFGPVPDRADTRRYQRYLRMYGTGFFGFRPRLEWGLFMRRVYEGKIPSIGVSCMLSGSLTATAVLDYLVGSRQFPVIPQTVHMDLMQHKVVCIGGIRRRIFRWLTELHLRLAERRSPC